MDNPKTDLYYAEKIHSDLAFIVKQMKGRDEMLGCGASYLSHFSLPLSSV